MIKLENNNSSFYDYIFPPIKRIKYVPNVEYETNNILHTSGIVYGSIGSGKTELFRSITEKAVKKYSEERVSSCTSPQGSIRKLIFWGTRPKLVNLLYADDITLRRIDKKVLSAYFKLRHIFKETWKINQGYILSMLGVHRFHSSPTELRTNMSFLIVKNIPSNPFDYSIMKKYLGEEHMKILSNLERLRMKDPKYKKYSIYWIKTGEKGILETKLARNNYVNTV